MTAVGHMSLGGDSSPHALMMQMREQAPLSLSRLYGEKMSYIQKHGSTTYDISGRQRSSSDGNSDSNDEGDVDMSEEDILEVDDARSQVSPEMPAVDVGCDKSPSMSPINIDIKMEAQSPRMDTPSPTSVVSSNQDLPVVPKVGVAAPIIKSTNFSIDQILRSDFGNNSTSANTHKSSSQPKPVARHRKFDFSVEALASQCWSGTGSEQSTNVTSYYSAVGFSPQNSISRQEAQSPSSSVLISPCSSISPSSSLSPTGTHSTSTSSLGADLGASPLRSPLSSPSTSPPRHYRSHQRNPITPYPCNPEVLKTLQHQTQQQQSYFQHLISATATTHELLASHAAAAAVSGFHMSPYSTGTPTILNHRYPIAEKLNTPAEHRDVTSSYNRAKRALSPLRVDNPSSGTAASTPRPNRLDAAPRSGTSSDKSPGSASSYSSAQSTGLSPVAAPIPTGAKSGSTGAPRTPATNTTGNPDSKDNKELWPAWVYCTRYSDRPSSGPRSRKNKKKKEPKEVEAAPLGVIPDEKRPRTAFTNEQLARLRREFDENRYLTEERRQNLARDLQLNESQIKIWFQNKRAKMKKSTGSRNALALQLMAQGLYNHATAEAGRNEGTVDGEKV